MSVKSIISLAVSHYGYVYGIYVRNLLARIESEIQLLDFYFEKQTNVEEFLKNLVDEGFIYYNGYICYNHQSICQYTITTVLPTDIEVDTVLFDGQHFMSKTDGIINRAKNRRTKILSNYSDELAKSVTKLLEEGWIVISKNGLRFGERWCIPSYKDIETMIEKWKLDDLEKINLISQ